MSEQLKDLGELTLKLNKLTERHKEEFRKTIACLYNAFRTVRIDFEWIDHESNICLITKWATSIGPALYFLPRGDNKKLLAPLQYEPKDLRDVENGLTIYEQAMVMTVIDDFISDYVKFVRNKVEKFEECLEQYSNQAEGEKDEG